MNLLEENKVYVYVYYFDDGTRIRNAYVEKKTGFTMDRLLTKTWKSEGEHYERDYLGYVQPLYDIELLDKNKNEMSVVETNSTGKVTYIDKYIADNSKMPKGKSNWKI